MSIAKTTVKTHLGHLYEKSGTYRQVDLNKLVAGFSNPLPDKPTAVRNTGDIPGFLELVVDASPPNLYICEGLTGTTCDTN